MPKRIDMAAAKTVVGTMYPSPFHTPCLARHRKVLGDAAGLTQFGVNLTTLSPGAWSSQRHWHSHEEEFIYIVSGEVVLVTNSGEEVLHAGDAAGFKAADPDGHCLQNRTNADVVYLEVGTRIPNDGDTTHYPDINMVSPAGDTPAMYTHRDGTPYPDLKRRGPGDE